MTGSELATVVVIIALATLVQGVSGFGFSLTSMPLLSALLGVEKALAIQTALSVASNGATAIRARSDLLVGTAARMLGAMAFGMPFGWLVLEHASSRDLKLLLGVVVGGLAIALTRRVQIPATGPGVDLISGFLAGVLSTSTGTNGPPLVIALSGRRLPAAQQRATLSMCFTVASVVVFTALLSTGRVDRSVPLAVAASLPIVVVVSSVGHRIFGRLHQHHYDRFVTILLFASAGVAIASALAD